MARRKYERRMKKTLHVCRICGDARLKKYRAGVLVNEGYWISRKYCLQSVKGLMKKHRARIEISACQEHIGEIGKVADDAYRDAYLSEARELSAEPRELWMFICPYCGVWKNQSIKIDRTEIKEGRFTNWRGRPYSLEVRDEKRKKLEERYRGRKGSMVCDICYESRMEQADSGERRWKN